MHVQMCMYTIFDLNNSCLKYYTCTCMCCFNSRTLSPCSQLNQDNIVQKPSTKSLKGRKRQAPYLSISILNTLAECVYLSEHPPAEGAVRTFHWSILTFIFMSTAQGRKLQYYRNYYSLQPRISVQEFALWLWIFL